MNSAPVFGRLESVEDHDLRYEVIEVRCRVGEKNPPVSRSRNKGLPVANRSLCDDWQYRRNCFHRINIGSRRPGSTTGTHGAFELHTKRSTWAGLCKESAESPAVLKI
ncbi:unnamed protein product, partial [Iphiclides podalirius]